jgi:hypothetical protein
MITDSELARLFASPPFVGTVLRYGSFLDYDLDCLLAIYFARGDRLNDALDLLIPELTFGRKIDVLRRLPLKHTKAHGDALAALRAFQKIRNLAAHSWTVSRAKCRDLLSDPSVRGLFVDYPTSLEAGFKLTRRRLVRLRQSKAFGADARAVSRELDVRAVELVLKNASA